MRFARIAALLLGLPLMVAGQTQSKAPSTGVLNSLKANIDIEGLETSYNPETGIATANGEAHIKYGDMEVEGGRADYNANTGDIFAKDHVTIVKAGVVYKGENITYNVNSGELHGTYVRSGMTHNNGTLFYKVDKVETASKYVERVDGEPAYITTHDLENPNFHFSAKSMTIYPNDRLVMHDVTVYMGGSASGSVDHPSGTPIFWLPYVTQPLDDENGYLFSPGFSSTWGAYLMNQYTTIIGDHTLAKYRLDLRSSRGAAGGADLIALREKDNDNWGKLKFYYADDLSPLTNKAGETRTDVPRDRFRVDFQHRIYITGPAERTWYFDFDIHKFSDQYFLEDFFLTEFLNNREPDNQVSLVHSDPRYTATLMAKFQLNDFYRTDTRLPEIAFDFTRQPVFNSGFFYQGSTSFDIMREKLGSPEKTLAEQQINHGEEFIRRNGSFTDPNNSAYDVNANYYDALLGLSPSHYPTRDDVSLGLQRLQDFLSENGFNRFHTYHEVLYPKQVFGFLNLVPRFGLGFQDYSDIRGSAVPSLNGGSASRSLVHAGLDASFKFSKTWDDVKSETFGLDGIKHVVQPYVNWSYLNTSNINGLPAIDRTVTTTRPLPLDIPLYTGIDSLTSWNIARIGVWNLLQTKRDGGGYTPDYDPNTPAAITAASQPYTWAGLNTYVDVYMKDPGIDPALIADLGPIVDAKGHPIKRSTSNLYNELFWRPIPWLSFSADTQLPLGGPLSYTEANYGVTFMPDKNISFTIGNQYLENHPLFPNSNLWYTRFYLRMNDEWGFSMNHVYEFAVRELQYQSYSVHRDFTSWMASFGFLQRDNGGVKDFGVIFSLTLKDFPQVTIPLDTDPNPTGRAIE